MSNEKFIDSLTDDDLDLLIEKIENRKETLDHEEKERWEYEQKEAEAKKICLGCNMYLSCRERRKGKCDNCGVRVER